MEIEKFFKVIEPKIMYDKLNLDATFMLGTY